MNELPAIGSLCLHTNFWNRHGAKIAAPPWRMVVLTFKLTILERDYCFFAAVLSEIDSGNVDMRKV